MRTDITGGTATRGAGNQAADLKYYDELKLPHDET